MWLDGNGFERMRNRPPPGYRHWGCSRTPPLVEPVPLFEGELGSRMPIDKPLFRRVLGSFAAGVTVITTFDQKQNPYGLTATAFTSVSILPPLVLTCVDMKSESYPH